jgi:hypothetical protein
MSHHLASRPLRRSRLLALGLAVFAAIGLRLSAQDQQLDSGIAPSSRAARPALPRPDMRVEPVDPEVERLLVEWSAHTSRITTLTGKHFRSTRDYEWGTETLAEGKFFISMPDKGRIDIGKYSPPSPQPGTEKTYPGPDGKNVKLTIKMDQKREKWICDGKRVRVIDDSRKTYEEVPIPANQQGSNMIDGPLPFLLGMPPEKAKARYRFRIINKITSKAGEPLLWLEVRPKYQLDAAEWMRAYVLLNLQSYLPERVSLFNNKGTTETVYIFKDLDTNERGMLERLFTGDPFRPNMFQYKREVHAPPPSPRSPSGTPMPMMIGASSKEALEMQKDYKQRGFDVEFKKGPKAETQEQLYHIESQDPAPNTPLQPGQKITLRYYDYDRTKYDRTANGNDGQSR